MLLKHRLIKQTLKSVLVLTLEYELISTTHHKYGNLNRKHKNI